MKNSAHHLIAALAITTLAGTAIAANKNVIINADVVGTCEFVDASDVSINFGALTAGMADQTKAGSTQFWCSNGVSYTVAANDGINFEAGSKQMTSGAHKLPYELTLDKTSGTGTGVSGPITLNLTATINGSDLDNAHVGTNYTDTVVLTLTP